LPTTPVIQSTVLAEAIAAPTRPPMRACEDEVGSPKYQVVKIPGNCSNESDAPTR
jgi:hypothetical protein